VPHQVRAAPHRSAVMESTDPSSNGFVPSIFTSPAANSKNSAAFI